MGKKVIIIGGGVAGMSAAHELIERGFEVEIYERHGMYCGGKARSVNVPGSNIQYPDKYLPGEHGFRFFPGFYKHVTDTMKRIPFSGNKNGVFDNLVPVTREEIARYGKKPIVTLVNFPKSLDDLKVMMGTLHSDTGLTEAEKDLFIRKIWQLLTSCYDRRANDYERISWWQYMEADNNSVTYQTLLVEGLTRTLVAANAKYASTKTGGDIFLQLLLNMVNPSVQTDRVLNGPTNDAWLNPWMDYLKAKGVKYHYHSKAMKLDYEKGLITGANFSVNGSDKLQKVTGDYYILAAPVEAAAPLITDDMAEYDMSLDGIKTLSTSVAWMNGLQYYLSEEPSMVPGHCIYSDSQWALTSISQIHFWNNYDLQNRGNGKAKAILSVDISDWEVPGLNGKIANECTKEEIKDEVWAQLKKSLNVNGQVILRDDMLVTWYLDGDISCATDGTDQDDEPLLVNRVNTWCLRPEAYNRISNFFLASDYVRTYTDLATMEGANEAARRAVNGILDIEESDASRCEIWNLHEPWLLSFARNRDQKRYDKGLPYKYYEPWYMKFFLWFVHLIMRIWDAISNLFKK